MQVSTKSAISITTTLVLAILLTAAAYTTTSTTADRAEAVMLSTSLTTYTLKNTAMPLYLQGTANYPTFHYELIKKPTGGTYTFNQNTGAGVYTPNAGFTGIDSLSYRIVSNFNAGWFSDTATIRIAVVEPWAQFSNPPYTPSIASMSPIDLAQYMKEHGLSVTNTPDLDGITNIEPYKQTAFGKTAYTNGKIAFELANGPGTWWSLKLGQKQWLMENYIETLGRAYIWYNFCELSGNPNPDCVDGVSP